MPNFVFKIILQLNIIYKGWLERAGILFICSFNHHLMNAYHVPGVFLSAGTVINVTSEKLPLGVCVLVSLCVQWPCCRAVRLGRHCCSGPEALAVALPSRLSSAPAVLNVLPDRVHIDHLLFGIEIDQVDLFKQECDLTLSTVVYCVLKKSPFGIFQS